MEGRCRPYRPPMRVQGDEGGKAATAGTGPGSSSGSGLMLRSLVGCLLPHLATAAIEKAAHVAAAVARRVMAPVAAAAAAVPCRVMVAPVATAAAVPCGMVAPVAGAVAPKLVAFRPPPPPITPVHQHQHQQAGPRYVARPAVQPMMGPPVVQATAGAAAVAAPRLLVGAPVKLLIAPQLLQRQQHNIQLANRVACVPYPHPHPAVQPQPVLVHGGMPAPRQPHQQQDQSLQMRRQRLEQAKQMWQAQRKKVQEVEAWQQRIQEAIKEEEDIVVANVRELMQRCTSGASKPFELIRLKRHLGQGAFGCVDCWEVTERQSATASSAASSSGLVAAAASGTATATSSSHTFEAAVKTCALDLKGLAAGGATPHSVEMHAKEAAAVLAVQALDSRHLVKVLGAYVDMLTPGEDVPPRGCGIANLHVGRIVMEVARESLTDVVTGHRVLAHCAAGGAAAAFDADSEDTSGYRLPETAVRVVLASVLLGLRDLHGRARLAHRDLKLDNLLVGTDRLIKITDFGLVTPLDSQGRLVSEVGGRRGTKGYQAPETLARRTFVANERDLPSWPAAKSDIYAVGVIGAALVCMRHRVGAGDGGLPGQWRAAAAPARLAGAAAAAQGHGGGGPGAAAGGGGGTGAPRAAQGAEQRAGAALHLVKAARPDRSGMRRAICGQCVSDERRLSNE